MPKWTAGPAMPWRRTRDRPLHRYWGRPTDHVAGTGVAVAAGRGIGDLAVDDDGVDAARPADVTEALAGQILDADLLVPVDRVGVEHDDVRGEPGREQAAVAKAPGKGGVEGDPADRLLQRHVARPADERAEQVAGVG